MSSFFGHRCHVPMRLHRALVEIFHIFRPQWQPWGPLILFGSSEFFSCSCRFLSMTVRGKLDYIFIESNCEIRCKRHSMKMKEKSSAQVTAWDCVLFLIFKTQKTETKFEQLCLLRAMWRSDVTKKIKFHITKKEWNTTLQENFEG